MGSLLSIDWEACFQPSSLLFIYLYSLLPSAVHFGTYIYLYLYIYSYKYYLNIYREVIYTIYMDLASIYEIGIYLFDTERTREQGDVCADI